MLKLVLSFALAGLSACTSFRVTDEDLLTDDNHFTVQAPKQMCGCDVQKDLKILSYTLKNGYGGRNFVPKEPFTAALVEIDGLNLSNVSPAVLCDRIGEILYKIPDMHLSARLNNKFCGPKAAKFKSEGDVGKNFITTKNKAWEVNYLKINRKKIPVLSITTFPVYEDKMWEGFEDALLKIREEAAAVIVDMRGNGGGSDSRGLQMVSYFFGQDNPSPIEGIIKSQTPASFALLANNEKLNILWLQKENAEVPEYLVTKYREKIDKFNLAKQKKLPEEAFIVPYTGNPYNPNKAFTNPIVLLMDKACASSCESTGKALKLHPKTVFIGENTGGYLHYGNVGTVILPSSRIAIKVATDFWKYKDGRFLEGIGESPDILVKPGQDALITAKDFLQKQLKK